MELLNLVIKIGFGLGTVLSCWYLFGAALFTSADFPLRLRRPPPLAAVPKDPILAPTAAPPVAGPARQKIVLFTTRFMAYTAQYKDIDLATKRCPRCLFTQDEARYWNQSDAVVLNGRFIKDPPPRKPHGQIWIYFHREAPERMDADVIEKLHKYRNLFNWTMTFRPDSDIHMPNAFLTTVEGRSLNTDVALKRFKSKSKMIAWIVSNCHPPSKREVLAKKLSAFVPVDVYGSCGTHKCPTPRSKSIGTDCRNLLSETYKFYFSAENSLCVGYVTEKFYDVLDTDMVPIVYGGANYTALGVPVGSYINVADFTSLQQLADYIKWLNDNPREYVKYLQARAGLETVKEGYWETLWCLICDKLLLQEENGPPRRASEHVYDDLWDWWNRTPDGAPGCVPPPKFIQ